ncbi:MAG: hypothetical protein JNM22_21075 [Saprospiraceae bacterium]|nr:hypothetical protein [Saprospiraceae bacterium]
MQLKVFLFATFVLSYDVSGQSNICHNIYLQDFREGNDQKTLLTSYLTDDLEEILTQCEGCIVLERKNYADIQKQIDNENQIAKIEKLSTEIETNLKTIGAEVILSGKVEVDIRTMDTYLRISFHNLITKEKKSKSIVLSSDIVKNPIARIEALKKDVVPFVTTTNFTHDSNGTKMAGEKKLGKETLIGIWKADNFEGLEEIQISDFQENGQLITRFYLNGELKKISSSGWDYENEYLLQKFSDGTIGKAKIDWVSRNYFVLTIIDNGNIFYKGVIRHFQRWRE